MHQPVEGEPEEDDEDDEAEDAYHGESLIKLEDRREVMTRLHGLSHVAKWVYLRIKDLLVRQHPVSVAK